MWSDYPTGNSSDMEVMRWGSPHLPLAVCFEKEGKGNKSVLFSLIFKEISWKKQRQILVDEP